MEERERAECVYMCVYIYSHIYIYVFIYTIEDWISAHTNPQEAKSMEKKKKSKLLSDVNIYSVKRIRLGIRW